MRIAYLCSDVDVQVFGHEGCSVHIREFTNALVDAGHEVIVLCAWAGKPGRVTANAQVYELQPSGLSAEAWKLLEQEPIVQQHHQERDLRSVLWNGWLLHEGKQIIESFQPDFIYERYALFGWAGIDLARALGVPLILELNAPLCEQQAGYEKFPYTQTAKGLERLILTNSDELIALTGWLADWAVSCGADRQRIHVLPDGVSDRHFGGPVKGDAVRQRYGLNGQRIIGFVGSFHHWHDVKGLVRAFLPLHRQMPDLRLLLVGDGEKRKDLQKLALREGIGDAVIFTGKVPHEEVPTHIAAMDVAVVPYGPIKDFFFSPLKLFESMAVGRPTVAAALGQITEVIQHGRTGCLYQPGDVEDLSRAIGSLLHDPAKAHAIGQAGRQHVLEHFTWSAITAQVVRIAQARIAQNAMEQAAP